MAKNTIKTPDGSKMDYKVAPLKKKTVKDKVAEELAKKAAKKSEPKTKKAGNK